MHGVLAVLVAAEEIDPATVRPSPLTSVVFTLLLVALVLLLWSFLRHMRRVQANLGPAGAAGAAGAPRPATRGRDQSMPAGPVDPAVGEGDPR